MIDTRQMRARDIAQGMRLKTIAGWNQTEEDWRLFLTLSPRGCTVAVHGDRVVGTVTTVRYGELSWIGMLLVDPAFRRGGIGTRLMQRAIESLRDSRTVRLDATPAGKGLYERLGFQSEGTLGRMTNDCLPALSGHTPEVCTVTAEGFTAIAALDRRVFGADRTPLLRALWKRALKAGHRTSWQAVGQGSTCAYCMGRRGTHFYQIGPLVAGRAADAIALCRAVIGELAGQAAVIDVPEGQHELLDWLCGLGFVEQRSFTRMCLGSSVQPQALDRQFAIAGPEFG